MKNNRFLSQSTSVFALALASLVVGCGGDDAQAGGGNFTVPPPPNSTPTPSPTPTPVPTPTSGTSTSTRQQEMLQAILREHNDARAEVGTPPLVLDDGLNRDALAYAEQLAASGQFQHSPINSRPGQGENLWAGTPSAFSYEEMAGAWIEEKQFYVHDRFPNVSNTGNWQDVGHYTQIIWRDTQKLGCGIATGSGSDILVCRYSPAGNVAGQFAY